MRKTPIILLAGVLAALILGDVIEIRWHPEKFMELPKTIIAFTKDNSSFIKIKDQFFAWKNLAGAVAGMKTEE